MSNKLKAAVTNTASGLIAACMGFGLMVTAVAAHAAPAVPIHADDSYLLSFTAIPVTGQSPADALRAAGFTKIVSEPDGLLRATAGAGGAGSVDVGADVGVIAGAHNVISLSGIAITPETVAGEATSNDPVTFSSQHTLGYISGISNPCTKSAELIPSTLTDGVHGMVSMNAAHEVGLQVESSSATLNNTSVECPHGAGEVFQLPVVASRKETFHLSVVHGNHDSVALPGFWPLNGASTVFVVTLKPMDAKK